MCAADEQSVSVATASVRPASLPHINIIIIIVTYKCITYNHFTALWILSGTTRVSRYQKKHSPTHTYRGHRSSLICFIHVMRSWHPPCSIHTPDSLFPQSLSKFSLVYLLAWHPSLHTPYISSSNHCHHAKFWQNWSILCRYIVPLQFLRATAYML